MIRISPGACARVLFGVVTALVLASVPAPLFRFVWGHDHVYGFVPFADRVFHLSNEATPAAWFSALALAACALVLVLIGRTARASGDRYARHWTALGWIFLYLSLDEASALHERTSGPLRALLGTGQALFLAWVIPATVIVAILGVTYLRFVIALPTRTRTLVVAAGAMYVGGALGMEFIESYALGTMGVAAYDASATRVVLTHIEETMEMAGTVVFLYALLDHIGARTGGTLQLAFERAAPHGPARPRSSDVDGAADVGGSQSAAGRTPRSLLSTARPGRSSGSQATPPPARHP